MANSLTYVITTLFRGDDLEQTEHVIVQLRRHSHSPRPIVVFNGGLTPRGVSWLEEKYDNVSVVELTPPRDWQLSNEFHYFDYVSTQLSRHVETDYYVKMDRDVCVMCNNVDTRLLDYASKHPEASAWGTLGRCERNLELDGQGLFDWLPHQVSFEATPVLNGGVVLFKTAAVRAIASQLEQHGREIWRGSLQVGEDDLFSLTLVGNGHQLQDCPLLRSFGMVEPAPYLRQYSNPSDVHDANAPWEGSAIVHGFKPYYLYRSFYEATQRLILADDTPIKVRSKANEKDLYCAQRIGQVPYFTDRLVDALAQSGMEHLSNVVAERLSQNQSIATIVGDPTLAMEDRVAVSEIVQQLVQAEN